MRLGQRWQQAQVPSQGQVSGQQQQRVPLLWQNSLVAVVTSSALPHRLIKPWQQRTQQLLQGQRRWQLRPRLQGQGKGIAKPCTPS